MLLIKQRQEAMLASDNHEVSHSYEDARWEASLIPPPSETTIYKYLKWTVCPRYANRIHTNEEGKKSKFRRIDGIVRLYINDGTDVIYFLSDPRIYEYEE